MISSKWAAGGEPGSVRVAVVIPAFQAESTIAEVLEGIPPWVATIIVVDDGSSDETASRVATAAERDQRIELLRHPHNLGVTAAMRSGIERAFKGDSQIVVKMDSDLQMSPDDLPYLLEPLLSGRADCAKGNRFRDLQALRQMPPLRRLGNLVLGFLCKAAVGYWNLYDPTNGFMAVRADVLKQVPLRRLRGYYFFEIALLAELYLIAAVVVDVPLPARYGLERSHLSLTRTMISFPPRLLRLFFRRILLKYFLFEFSIGSLYLLVGLPLLTFGTVHGLINWWYYARQGIGAPTGTVVISAMLVLLGAQLLLAATQADLEAVPRERVGKGPLMPQGSRSLHKHTFTVRDLEEKQA